MLCQNCNKNEADVHYVTNINGTLRETYLCHDCVMAAGYGMLGGQDNDYLGAMLSNVMQESASDGGRGARCPGCDMTGADIIKEGKVGCAQCYTTFAELLNPYIRRIHGNAIHAGKFPARAGTEIAAERELSRLKREMQEAVDAQEYERAAKIRDEIKALEGGGAM